MWLEVTIWSVWKSLIVFLLGAGRHDQGGKRGIIPQMLTKSLTSVLSLLWVRIRNSHTVKPLSLSLDGIISCCDFNLLCKIDCEPFVVEKERQIQKTKQKQFLVCMFFSSSLDFSIFFSHILQLATVPPLPATLHILEHPDLATTPSSGVTTNTSTGSGGTTTTTIVDCSSNQLLLDSIATYPPPTAFVDSYHSPEFCFEQTSAAAVAANYMLGSDSSLYHHHHPQRTPPLPPPPHPHRPNYHHDGEFPRIFKLFI